MQDPATNLAIIPHCEYHLLETETHRAIFHLFQAAPGIPPWGRAPMDIGTSLGEGQDESQGYVSRMSQTLTSLPSTQLPMGCDRTNSALYICIYQRVSEKVTKRN